MRNGKANGIYNGELVESRVTVKHSDYNINPGDTLKVVEVGKVRNPKNPEQVEERVVVEPIHLTGTKLVLPAKAVKRTEIPDNYLELDEMERARISGLGDIQNMPEDIIEDLESLPDTDDIVYE